MFVNTIFLVYPGNGVSRPLGCVLDLVFALIIVSSIDGFRFSFSFALPGSRACARGTSTVGVRSTRCILDSYLGTGGVGFSGVRVRAAGSGSGDVVVGGIVVFSGSRGSGVVSSLTRLSGRCRIRVGGR